jgi:hypothetical protein
MDMARGSAKYVELKKNETTTVRINLKDYSVRSPAIEPGVYSVLVTYGNQYGDNCFKGSLKSELHNLVVVSRQTDSDGGSLRL